MDTRLVFTDNPKDSMIVKTVFEGEANTEAPKSFKGKKLETVYLIEKNLFIASLGKKETVETDYYRRIAAKAAKTASVYRVDSIHFSVPHVLEKTCVALFEGTLLGNYSFDKYKSAEEKNFLVKNISFPAKAKSFKDALEDAEKVCVNVSLVRDLVSDNSDVVTPEFLEHFSKSIATKHRLKFKCYREKELKKMGMNLLLGVGAGSKVRPRLIEIEYRGAKTSKEKILFVGKGVCFDSGGLNIKVGDSMKTMRMDMAGAATVLGIIKSAAELRMKKNIVVLMACVENLVDSNSYRPGDIIKSYSGLTVENLNTDAEGRLILADALSFGTKKHNPKVVVEFSTLTGSVVAALGSYCAGMMATNKEFSHKMFESGMATYERVWEFPLFEEYLDETKGERSDLKSLGKTRYNGTIFGGAFLSKFVNEKPFIHLDVAGTAMLEEPKDYSPKDGSGFGLRLAIDFLKRI